MNDKTKLYVFSSKEVILISIFIFLMGLTLFVLGVKIGKQYAFNQAGFASEDLSKVQEMAEAKLKSEIEEKVEADTTQAEFLEKSEQSVSDETFKSLQEKYQQEFEAEVGSSSQEKATDLSSPTQVKLEEVAPAKSSAPESKKEGADVGKYSGKYTIQLGSHQTLEDAQKFAQAFSVRGYNPIVNEVRIKGKGIWYRVSLGVFESTKDAKKYIEDQKSLFQGEDYVIARFE